MRAALIPYQWLWYARVAPVARYNHPADAVKMIHRSCTSVNNDGILNRESEASRRHEDSRFRKKRVYDEEHFISRGPGAVGLNHLREFRHAEHLLILPRRVVTCPPVFVVLALTGRHCWVSAIGARLRPALWLPRQTRLS